MRDALRTYSFGLALVSALLVAPSPALASSADVDLSPVYERLDTLSAIDSEMETDLHDLSQEMQGLGQDLRETKELQQQIRDELQGLRADNAEHVLTMEEHEAITSIDATLKAMSEPEPEDEGENVESEPEPEPYIDIDGIAQLLMLNVGCSAVLIGLQAFGGLWETLAGMK